MQYLGLTLGAAVAPQNSSHMYERDQTIGARPKRLINGSTSDGESIVFDTTERERETFELETSGGDALCFITSAFIPMT